MPQYHISIPLSIGEDPTNGNVVLGFEHNGMFIFDPTLSSCGRFKVNPIEHYQLDGMEAAELGSLNRFLQYRAEKVMEAVRLDVHMSLDYPDDSSKFPVDHAACQNIARALAVETLRLMGQSNADDQAPASA